MANKKISELPYIGVGKLSGNTLVPLVTYYSATTGNTVHTYTEDLQSYILSGQTITGATYSAGTITFTNNSGGTFSVSGITTLTGNFLSLSGGSVTGSTQFTAGLSANTISATTYQNLPTDITITGGTLSGNTIIFTNNTGGTFNVTGITDNYVTGGTFNYTTNQLTLSQQNGNVIINGLQDKYFTGTTWNTGTYDLSINRNDGFSSTVSLAILASDLKVTGGTYNSANGVATFTNNSGGTFQVTGFLTGYTDTFVTGGTYSNGTITFKNNSGTTFTVTGLTNGDFLSLSGGTVTGDTVFTQGLTGNTLLIQNNIDSQNRNLKDSSGFQSLDWGNRSLKDPLGNNILDWSTSKLSDSINDSLDWDNRILYGTDGVTQVFNWSTGVLSASTISADTLNISSIGSGTSITNLGIDVNGNIVSGSTGTSGILTGQTLGNGLSIFNSGTTNTLFFNSITGDSLNKITASTSNNTIEIGINEQNLTLWPLVVTGNRLIDGSVSYVSGLTFSLSPLSYIVDAVVYNISATTQVTLNSGDTTFDRIDVIYADISGNTGVLQGTPSANPEKPIVDSNSQVEVTFVSVPANSSTPTISTKLIYDENVGQPTEWNFFKFGNQTFRISGDSTAQSYSGSKSISVSGLTNSGGSWNNGFILSATTPTDTNQYATLQFAIRNMSGNSTNTIIFIQFLGQTGNVLSTNNIFVWGGGATSNYTPYNATTNVTSWQLISIPLWRFYLSNTNVYGVRFSYQVGSTVARHYFDKIELVEGSASSPPTNSWLNIRGDATTVITPSSPNATLTISGGTNIGSFISGTSTVVLNLDNNITLGSVSATTITANTLNVRSIGSGTSITNLGIDVNGNIVSGSTGTSGGGSGTSGTSGINGTSGTSGINGTSGTSGIDGTSGTSGINGTSGTSGTSGINGTSGTSGISGTSGTSGIDGTSGTSGISGTSGTSGLSGTSGIDGTSGTSGINGTSGIDGTSGTSGSSGTSGISGTSGTSGINGTSGTSGINGTSGTSGINGTSGTSGVAQILNNVNNNILTATGTSGIINGETNFTFDGTNLNVTGNTIISSGLTANTLNVSSIGSGTSITNLGIDINGNIVSGSTNSNGVWGITNSGGTYTYYSTLTLALSAATSGQTIQLFANVTETSAVTITLKNGVNINGNGYTYTLNTNDATNAFVTPVTVNTSLSFTNINIIRSVGSGDCMVLGSNSTSTIDFSGTRMINTGTGNGFRSLLSSSCEISNLYASATSGIGIQTNDQNHILKFCEGKSTSDYGIHSSNGGAHYNCIGISSSSYGVYIAANNGSSYNSIGISSSNSGFFNAGYALNCVGRSTSGAGFVNNSYATGCIGISTSGAGLSLNGSQSFNCDGWSSSASGIRMATGVEIYNCTSYSVSSYSLWNTNGNTNKLYNCNITTDYNNAAGYGVRGNIGNFPLTFVNCTFRLANNTAPYLFNDGNAKAIELVNNVYQGGAVYNSNLTQSVVTTKDNQGNIFM